MFSGQGYGVIADTRNCLCCACGNHLSSTLSYMPRAPIGCTHCLWPALCPRLQQCKSPLKERQKMQKPEQI
jgi:hypothetical protein